MPSLCDTVARTCASLRAELSAPVAAQVDDVVRRLSGTLQLAVAGRIKAGKSTVVNALIGRRVAPTDVRECTRIVTRFRYGTVDRVEVVCDDGQRLTVPYDGDGLVPEDLGVEPAKVAYLDAFLTSDVLRDVTVIDTPGLGSLDEASAQRTTRLLGAGVGPTEDDEGLDDGSREAIARAEAVLFVLTQAARADDVDTLSIFHAYTTPKTSNPVNAIAVLNKADQIVATDAPSLDAAAELAKAQAATLRHRVSDVLPLVGLIAETAETGQFTESDADVLRALAEVDDPLLFYSADLFLRPDVAVAVPQRERLLTLLDLFGIRRAVELLGKEPDMSTGELRRRLVDGSGFPSLRSTVDNAFRRRADGIKANVALATLEVVAAEAPVADRDRIRDGIEGLLQRPESHQLRLLDAAALVASGTVSLPDELTAEVARLAGGGTPAEQLGTAEDLAGAALDAANRWRSFATFGSTPAQSRVAHVVHRTYFLLWRELS